MSFEQILDFIRSQNEFIIYAILLLSAYIENIVPPFPGDAVMLSGAYLAGKGNTTYIGVIVSVMIGGVLGAMTLYFIGKSAGRRFFETGKGRYLIKGNLNKVDRMFDKHGSGILLISRFMPGIRSAIAVSAGIADFNRARMLILTTISFILWYGLLLGLMIYSKSNWRMIVNIVRQFNIVLISIGAIILIAWILRAIWRKRNSK